MTHRALMLDNENLSLSPRGAVLQVGFCVADLDIGVYERAPTNVWLQDVDIEGRQMDMSTIRWWSGQSEHTRGAVFSPPHGGRMSKGELFALLQQIKPDSVWAWHITMDLAQLFDLWGCHKPWSHKVEYDLPTLALAVDPDGALRPAPNTGAHNAAADANWQMDYLIRLWARRNQLKGA